VPFEDIALATVRDGGKHVTGIIALGVGIDLVLIAALAAVASSTWGSCGSMSFAMDASPEIRWTERPFDRVHARFFDESVAGPGSSAPVPAMSREAGASTGEAGAGTAR
jgi:hypothetical protein